MDTVIIMMLGTLSGMFFGVIGLRRLLRIINERRELRAFMREWNSTDGLCGWLIADYDEYHQKLIEAERRNALLPSTIVTPE